MKKIILPIAIALAMTVQTAWADAASEVVKTQGAEIITVPVKDGIIDTMSGVIYSQVKTPRNVQGLRMTLMIPHNNAKKPAIVYFPGGGFTQTLITVILGLVVVQLFLVADAAVAALHPHIHAVLGGSGLHGKKGIGSFGLQSLVDGGGRAAFLGLDGVVLRHLVGAADKDHAGVVQNGLRLCGGKGALLHAVFGGLLKALGRQLGQLRYRSFAGAGVGGAARRKAEQRRQAEQTPGMMFMVVGRIHRTYLLSQKRISARRPGQTIRKRGRGKMKMTAQEYARRVQKAGPHSPLLADCLWAFCVGGGICLLGEGLRQLFLRQGADAETAGTLTSCTLILLSAVLTTLGWYQKLAAKAGAGSLVPITGFANAVVSAAIEFKAEGRVPGTGAKMFLIAGPVIVYGTLAAVVYGVVLWLLGASAL